MKITTAIKIATTAVIAALICIPVGCTKDSENTPEVRTEETVVSETTVSETTVSEVRTEETVVSETTVEETAAPETNESDLRSEWAATSEEEREETCAWYNETGEELARIILNEARADSKTEEDVEEAIQLMNDEC